MFFNLFRHTTIYKTFNFLRSSIRYIKLNKSVGKIFHSNDFKLLLRKYLNINVKTDWLGRLYGIINPIIDVNGNLNISTMVIEIDGNDTNNSEWVKNWLYKQLNLTSQLFKLEKLYDYISMDIEHVGPIEMDNYLIIFDLVYRLEFAKALKSLLKNIGIWIVLIGLFFLSNAFFHFL